MDELAYVEIEPAANATASVIWLHGLGADGHDFEPIVPHLGIAPDLAIRFVFPHAPRLPVTINNGHVMPAWYDVFEMDLSRKVDETQLRASAIAVSRLITRENERGINTNRIILAGFSQGGAVAFELALSHPERLAGLVALSTYFATRNSVDINPANAGLPIFIGHGTRDPVVAESFGADSFSHLTEMGYAVEYHTYAVEHGVDLEEIQDIGRWITLRLA
jgi:phospholipase/carboxylesterase